MAFTKEQIAAIDHEHGNLQLLACAGSGKTEVVARRTAKLLSKKLCAPRNIVAFTFTEKAAAELKDRIYTRCQEELGAVIGMAELYVGTIHGFCLDLLHREVPEFLKYGVLNEVQQTLFVDRNSRKSGLTDSFDLKNQALRRYVDTQHYVNALSIMREAQIVPKELAGVSVASGLDAYRALLRDKRYLDYTSIMHEALTAIRSHKALRVRIKERVKFVTVDEYQDLNPLQESIVRELHDLGASICVVGDDDQTIYQWRGSDVQNILTFAKRYPKVKQVPLEANFRSSKGVVETARVFVEQNGERLPKQMKASGEQVYEEGDICALKLSDPADEAQFIVKRIQDLHGVAFSENGGSRGLAYSDFAVLLRSVGKNGQPITEALKTSGIPFIVVGMNNLFDTEEANAARLSFYYVAAHIVRDGTLVSIGDLEKAWGKANLEISKAKLTQALSNLTKLKTELKSGVEKRFAVYSVQKVYLALLEDLELREEKVPKLAAGAERGEVAFYNLGKFSQLISDFEEIHFQSRPEEKYEAFAKFLEFGAEGAYSEGWQDNQYANPDAVKVMTVHQAKGMQWPVVFTPCLLRNRFPAAAHGGRNVWHLLPTAAVQNHHRYKGTLEDERRLFYVAMTRAQKFLFMTWAPVSGSNNRYIRASEFWDDVLQSKFVLRRLPDFKSRKRLNSQAKAGVKNVVFSFSDIKYFFECPYQFKLRVLYGFNAPIHEGLGYGKSLHDSLAELHARAIDGKMPKAGDAKELVERHLHVPYAYPVLRETMEAAAQKVIAEYIRKNEAHFKHLEFSEKDIQINLGDGVSVVGRIDLVRRLDTNEISIVDLKTSERAQEENVTETQLHIYALGYQELTGRKADYVEIYELEEQKRKPRSVDSVFIDGVKVQVEAAAKALRGGGLAATPSKAKCMSCDLRPLCGKSVAK